MFPSAFSSRSGLNTAAFGNLVACWPFGAMNIGPELVWFVGAIVLVAAIAWFLLRRRPAPPVEQSKSDPAVREAFDEPTRDDVAAHGRDVAP